MNEQLNEAGPADDAPRRGRIGGLEGKIHFLEDPEEFNQLAAEEIIEMFYGADEGGPERVGIEFPDGPSKASLIGGPDALPCPHDFPHA